MKRSPIKKMSDKRLAAAGGRVPFSTIAPSGKGVKRVNTKRKASNFKRAYHSKARLEFVKSLRCAACGVEGYSDNAHLTPVGEKGTGYKGGYRFIAPLCHNRMAVTGPRALSITYGCHGTFDKERWRFDKAFPGFSPEEAAAETERLWLEASA